VIVSLRGGGIKEKVGKIASILGARGSPSMRSLDALERHYHRLAATGQRLGGVEMPGSPGVRVAAVDMAKGQDIALDLYNSFED
jgi:hypothetical protein